MWRAEAALQLPPQLSTGHPEVDAQHAAILEEAGLLRGAHPEGLSVMVAFLRQHVRSHFSYEELLMAEVRYPDAARHALEHRRFNEVFTLLQARLDRDGGTPESVAAIAAAVEQWVAEHVLLSDVRLAEFIRASRAT
jgi:hemerythrin-like metal-binding protein